MADPAAQSPFVSSSSSARPEPAGPACRGIGAASCADPLVSSSQPVSLFAASPAVSGGSPPPPREAFVPLSSSSSSSSSSPGGGAEPPQDSPGSPFELVLDRAAFDREYPPALSERGGALSQIPEDRICDFPAKPPRGSGPPSQTSNGFPVPKHAPPLPPHLPPGLCRQTSGTAAALEEVSKCVREMHSFTSEMLSWDWVERGDGPPPGEDGPPPGEEDPPPIDGAPPGDAESSGDSDDTVIEEPPAQRGSSYRSPPPPGANVGPPRSEISSSSSSSPPRPEIAPPGVPKIAAPRPPEADLERLREATEEPPPRPPRACWLPPLAVQELVLWRDARRSGAVFGGSLALLLSLAAFSAVSVAAHAALALLCGTVSYRVYRAVVCALQKADEGHPFRTYLELDLTLSPEAFQSHAAAAMAHVNHGLRLLLRLFLVEDLVDSLKLAVAMWLLTHVGAVFNGITLLILADLLAFTVPPFYEKYKAQIDHYVNMAREQSKSLVEKVQAKVPGMAKKKPE